MDQEKGPLAFLIIIRINNIFICFNILPFFFRINCVPINTYCQQFCILLELYPSFFLRTIISDSRTCVKKMYSLDILMQMSYYRLLNSQPFCLKKKKHLELDSKSTRQT